jgi:hypothetical protein
MYGISKEKLEWMYAMQYEITLPADYEMGIIRRRVEVMGHVTGRLPRPRAEGLPDPGAGKWLGGEPVRALLSLE